MKSILSSGKTIIVLATLALFITGCQSPQTSRNENSFNFIFATDIHIQPEKNATKGFLQAIDTINKLKPDFVITGGDLIMDALGQSYPRADSLYKLYVETSKKITSPVYNTMGNHEIYGIYQNSGADPTHPEYGEKMFERRLGKSYYDFNHKGWKFMVLNSVEDAKKNRYIGMIDSAQQAWIMATLKSTQPEMPIVLITHIPFITANTQIYQGSTIPNDSSTVVSNAKEVIDMFKGYNLKLVLQGHLHTVEDIYIDGIHFITGGAVCGKWWNGPNIGYEEGFVRIDVSGDYFHWEYVDYGWEAEP